MLDFSMLLGANAKFVGSEITNAPDYANSLYLSVLISTLSSRFLSN
jgi:hypothetical protein